MAARARSEHGDRDAAGFTLVEVLVTVVLVSLVAVAISASLVLAIREGPNTEHRSTFGGDTAFLINAISDDVANSKPAWPDAGAPPKTCLPNTTADLGQMQLYDNTTVTYTAEVGASAVFHNGNTAVYQVDVKRKVTASGADTTTVLLTAYCSSGNSLGDGADYVDPTYTLELSLQATQETDARTISASASRRTKLASSFSLTGHVYGDADGDGFWDGGEPGLSNTWTVTITGDDGTVVTKPTDASGLFSATLVAATYTVCTTAKTGWTITAPAAGAGIVSCASGNGYTVNPAKSTSIDFGEQSDGSQCNVSTTRTIITSQPVGGQGVAGAPANYHTVQAAYDAAKAASQTESVAILSNTTENVVLNGSKALSVNQCGSAQVTAADATKPVFDITSTGKLTIVSPDAKGGTYGWLVETGGHDLKSIRAINATVAGIKIVGSNNSVNWNAITNNAVGVEVTGTNNSLDGNSINNNTSYGVHFYAGASNNTLKTTIKSNGSDGIYVEGANNTLDSNKVSSNVGDGIRITGAGTKLTGNQSNQSGENTGAEYRFTPAGTNQGGNKADGQSVPAAGKCPTFAQANSVCE